MRQAAEVAPAVAPGAAARRLPRRARRCRPGRPRRPPTGPSRTCRPRRVPPNHVAIIMDGNGRWAAARSLPRVAGHRAGAQAVRRTVESAIRHGVGWITLYAFSSENWRRPAGEVIDLTGLLRHYLRNEVAELKREGVRLRFIGDRDRFEADIVADLAHAEQRDRRQFPPQPDAGAVVRRARRDRRRRPRAPRWLSAREPSMPRRSTRPVSPPCCPARRCPIPT